MLIMLHNAEKSLVNLCVLPSKTQDTYIQTQHTYINTVDEMSITVTTGLHVSAVKQPS